MDLHSARELACNLVTAKTAEWVNLDQALGRVLAEPLTADLDLPGEPRSRMDGYALHSGCASGVTGESTVLLLAEGCAAAGHVFDKPLAAGSCLRILTGAQLPAGADAVVAQEDVEVRGDTVVVRKGVSLGQWVLPPGVDVAARERVLEAGTVLTPTALALAAALGKAGLRVHQQPRVALLGTGDELLELGETRSGPHSICNNRHLLAWMTRLQGGVAVHLGVARDDPDEITERLADVNADLVITTGGIGHGDRDFVLKAWENLEVTVHFRRINLSPGRHSGLGSRDRQLFCALPGNPWAAQVVFSEIIAPMLRRWQGFSIPEPPTWPAHLATPVHNRSGLHRAIRGVLENREGTMTFRSERSKDRSLFAQLKASPAYALIPPEPQEMQERSVVQAAWFDWPLLAIAQWVDSSISSTLN